MVFNEKAKTLMDLFDKLPFQQALVFTNDKARYMRVVVRVVRVVSRVSCVGNFEGFPGQGPAIGGSSERPRLAGRVPRWRAAAAHPRPHHGRLPRGQAPHPRLHRPRTSTSLFDHGRFSQRQFAHLVVSLVVSCACRDMCG